MKSKKTNKPNFPMFAFGTTVQTALDKMLADNREVEDPTRIQSPNEAIVENQLAWDKAAAQANNGWTTALDIFGNLGMQVGTSMMSKGRANGEGVTKGGFDFGSLMDLGIDGLGALAHMAFGGMTGPGDKKKPGQKTSSTKTLLTGDQLDEYNEGKDVFGDDVVFYQEGADALGLSLEDNTYAGMDQIDLGRFKDVGYYNVKNDGNTFTIIPTANNKLNYVAYKQHLDEIKALNPNASINDRGFQYMSQRRAYGGPVGNPVEVEGDEVAMMPDGNLLDFQGPSHEQGGMDVTLPDDTMVYSKRIKVDGMTLADRKKGRHKRELSLQNLLDMNETDAILKNTLSRTKQNNQLAENYDTEVQKQVRTYMDSDMRKAAYGIDDDEQDPRFVSLDGVQFSSDNASNDLGMYDVSIPGVTDFSGMDSMDPKKANKLKAFWQSLKGSVESPLEGATFGDGVNLIGDMISTFEPERIVQANRAGDQPNINFYEGFGEDGLKTIQEGKQYINQMRDQSLMDVDASAASATSRNRNTARGVNTQRALDLATQNAVRKQKAQIYSQALAQMMGLVPQEASQQNLMDQMEAQGATAKDLADRQDRDNYYTQLGKAVMSKGKGLQQIGKEINKIRGNKEATAMIEQMKKLGMEDNDIKIFLQNLYATPGFAPPQTQTKKS